MHVSSGFDSGNINVLDASDAANIRLAIEPDANSEHMQWFHFRVTGARDLRCRFVLENAAAASYAEAWPGYRVCASYDRQDWFRLATEYDGDVLAFSHVPAHDNVYYAYFAPYSIDRHADLVAWASATGLSRYRRLGATLDGRDLDLLEVGDTETAKRHGWIIARQHPGESMAEWWMEGFLERLLDDDDAVANAVRREMMLHIVPNMNPDGSARGHLRTNAAGANLNREWADPTAERSPEVLHVRAAMHETGCDFALDVHGDEALPYNFIAGAEGIEKWSDRLAKLQLAFCQRLQAITPDFQTEHGYDVDPPNSSDYRKNTDYMAQQFDCLAMTLEMPFKDTADTPMPDTGWSPERCRQLGRDCLLALYQVMSDLR